MNLPNGLPPLPVTVIGGFLGAGKTTLLNHLLRTGSDRRIGVLVNDFGDIGIDQDLVLAETEDVVSLANGCVCSSLRGDMTSQIMTLAEVTPRPEHLIVEASGISEPGAILQAMLELERYQVIRLDGFVTVVDASEHDWLEDKAAQLARRQRQAADLIVLSKADLVSPREARGLKQSLEEESSSKVLVAHHGEVPIELVLGLEGENERLYERSPEMRLKVHPVRHELTRDWTTWRFRSSQPVVFKALIPLLRNLPVGIYRAKGFLHLVERLGDRLVLHLAGRRVQIRTVGRWNGTPPRSELVLIGRPDAVDPESLRKQFEACLEGRADPGEAPPRMVGWLRD